MASQLASQLQALAVATGGASTSSKISSRPTLLFHPSEAADIDLQTIFTLSQTGLDELVIIDGRFKAFRKTLFSIESSQIDREQQPKDYNEKLNKSIATFLQLLSGYVMLTSAHQTLEYLIRRYKIQIYNVADVVLCLLPYHETSLFVRVVQLLQIKNTRWQFLESVQSTGAAVPRAVLVQRCTHDMALVESVCELAMAVSGIAAKSRTTITFASVVLIETLAEVPTVPTDLMNRILPSLLHSFKSGIAEEFRVGALMIIGTLANRCSLAPSLAETLVDHISRAFHRSSETEGDSVVQLHVMVLIHLVQTQEMHFPSKSFKTLVKVRDFIPILTELVKRFDAQKFLRILVQFLVEHVIVRDHDEHVLCDVIKSLPVGSQVVPSVLRLLEISFGEGDQKESQADSSKPRNPVKKVLLAMEKRFPAELDKAISLHFQKSKVHKGKKKEDPVFIFLCDVFQGSLRIPLEETHMSLYLSLDHPEASIREIAIKQLSKLAATKEATEGAEIYAVLREAYLRRLRDDGYNVVRAVLLVDNLVEAVPADRLFPALAAIISRCNADLVAGERSSKRDAKVTCELAVELLAHKFIDQHPEYVEQVSLLFFEHLLQRPLSWRLNRLVFREAGFLRFELFGDLSRLYNETPFGEEKEAAKSKEKRRLWQIAVNAKIIKSLAVKLLEDSTSLVPILLNPSLPENSKFLVVLILLQCLNNHSQAMSTKFIDASLQWLRYEWAIEGSAKSASAELQAIDYAKWKDLNSILPDLYQLEIQSTTAYAGLLLPALYSLVMCVPRTNVAKLENQGDGGEGSLNELFLLFAGSSSMKVFTPHVDLLLSRLPAADILSFLSKFFIQEGSAVPAFVQVHSLNVLASQLETVLELKSEAVDRNVFKHLQSALLPLFVAFASPLKAVRKSAIKCMEVLSSAWEKHSSGREGTKDLDAPLLNPISFGKILEIVTGAKAGLISSGTYLEELWKENYGITDDSTDEPMIGDEDEHHSIIMFFVDEAIHLTVYGQRVVFKVLQGMAHCSGLVHATQERLNELVERRALAHLQGSSDGPNERLTQAELQLLEVLLQMYNPSVVAEFSQARGGSGEGLLSSFFRCLTVDGGSLADPAILQPCLAALKALTPDFYCALGVTGQDLVFQSLISLSAANSETIRSSAHASLRTLQISASTVAWHLESLLEVGLKVGTNERRTKRRKASGDDKISIHHRWPVKEKLLTSTSSILEFLIWKTDMERRETLLAPLFKLAKAIIGGVWTQIDIAEEGFTEGHAAKGGLSQAAVELNAQHLIFMILDGIVKSLSKELTDQKHLINDLGIDVDTVVLSVNKAVDGTTRNHGLALLTSLGKLIPGAVLKHLVGVLSVVGESTLTQDDSHSHQVVSQMLNAVVPGWLAIDKDPTLLLEVFVNALPRVPSHRRMATITNLLRVISEKVGLHVFVFLLLRKVRASLRSDDPEPEGILATESKETSKPLDTVVPEFAASLFRQYSPGVKVPAMVRLLDISRVDSILHSSVSPDELSRRQAWVLQQLCTQFVANELQASELHVGAQLAASSDSLQKSYVALMEQVLQQLQMLTQSDTLPAKLKKSAQEAAVSVLDGLTLVMAPTDYIRGISSLMKHSDTNIRRKVLRMYSSKTKELNKPILVGQRKKKGETVASVDDKHLSEQELNLRVGIVNDITSLLAGITEEKSVSTKLAAIDALNASAERFAQQAPDVFVSSLAALVANLRLKNRALRLASLRCMATSLAKLGPLALPALPETVPALFEIAEQALTAKSGVGDEGSVFDGNDSVLEAELLVALLEALEALLDKLGAFLTPYLETIVGLLLVRSQLIRPLHAEVYQKAVVVRTLLSTRIPVRLLLDPLLCTYRSAMDAGEDSLCALFDMLAAVVAKADRPSVAAYYGKIFEFCLTAFDLRGRPLSTLQSVSRVETSQVNAVVSLVMKLSETTFKPLFVKVLEWAASETEIKDGSFASQSVDRNIVFYKLVNQLASKLRSVFVPYLQYLITGCVHHLTGGLTESEVLKPKKKKKKNIVNVEQKATLSPSEWHLRQLILSSLHQCFLYDTIGFLDAPKFQLLLGPIVSQLVVEAPTDVPLLKQGEAADIATVQEMDDTLVSCLGQMALTAGTDLLWKPLNHEVLMCTRFENVRTRLLGLRVVKFLAEHLKEEYLVLLPETIPFLAELLEDTELTVVAKTQEVVKYLEDLSGEDLSQYF